MSSVFCNLEKVQLRDEEKITFALFFAPKRVSLLGVIPHIQSGC